MEFLGRKPGGTPPCPRSSLNQGLSGVTDACFLARCHPPWWHAGKSPIVTLMARRYRNEEPVEMSWSALFGG